ncbi:unnamed protein product [Soboliphyme baturini]|uniref:BEN domain-containing protein n=1 Tax=Soboliphyme baturini TaxID=241478 RepID=A0A183IYB7_9BILA|nr:unnamed protein product [Soboliphyme baturini]
MRKTSKAPARSSQQEEPPGKPKCKDERRFVATQKQCLSNALDSLLPIPKRNFTSLRWADKNHMSNIRPDCETLDSCLIPATAHTTVPEIDSMTDKTLRRNAIQIVSKAVVRMNNATVKRNAAIRKKFPHLRHSYLLK